MSELVFWMRLGRMRQLEQAGHVELEEFLGPNAGYGPLVRTALLRREAKCCDYERYFGHVPTPAGERFLLYDGEHHIMMVRAGMDEALRSALARDPMPNAAYHANYEPRGARGVPEVLRDMPDPEELQEVERTKALRWYRYHGYHAFEVLRKVRDLKAHYLVAAGLCRPNDPGSDGHDVPLVPVGMGERLLRVVGRWNLLLVRPGMALQVEELLKPAGAGYWTSCPL
jgi:hypothetical protein